MTAEQFMMKHFNGIEKETWYPAIVALAEGYAKQEAKTTQRKIDVCISSINGALDGLQLDNTCDVIEKSIVIEQLTEQLNILKPKTI